MTTIWVLYQHMTTTSISQLKINPSSIIAQASEYPIAVENRNTIQGYIMGKALYEKMVELLEDRVDRIAVKQTNFKTGKSFEKIAHELGI